MKTIGLCMIVKDEAPRILRCLESVRPIVDFALIFDTGSKDDTMKIVADWMLGNKIEGDVYEVPWRDFAKNRSEAIETMREYEAVDYTLMLDADDELEVMPGFKKELLDADHYMIPISLGAIEYERPQLFSNKKPYRYRGVIHEFLEAPPDAIQKRLSKLRIKAGVSGARSEDVRKYLRDAMLIELAMVDETDEMMRSRYAFYLAQSYRDAGMPQKSEEWYLKRTEMDGWEEEVFLSLIYAARLQAARGEPFFQVLGLYKQASYLLPGRAVEADHAAVAFCRQRNRFLKGYAIAVKHMEPAVLKPPLGLFIERWIYDYGIYDELSVCAYYAGDYSVSRDACRRALSAELDQTTLARVRENLRFAEERIAGKHVK